jgi:hypothetical protein
MRFRQHTPVRLLVLLALSPAAGAQTVRYDTQGFEQPGFVTGQLAGATMTDGQDGWLVTDDGSETIDRSLIRVQTGVALGGSQAVEIVAAGQPAPWAHLRRNAPFDVTADEPVVEIRMDMMIESSAVKTDAWGLQAQNAPGPIGGLFIWDVFPDDHVHMYDETLGFVDTGFVLTRDAWHHTRTAIDFENQVVQLTIDGQRVGEVPVLIGGQWWAFTFASIYLGLPGDDRMYVDDFVVLTRDHSGGGPIERYCQNTANSTGGPAVIDASGSSSVAANDLGLSAAPVPNQPGLFFYGTSQIELPFGDGYRCTGGTVVRFPAAVPSGQSASYAVDTTSLPHGAQIVPGDVLHFQYWFRDPAAGGAGFNTSDALRITFLP